jgi:hypothetical protein
MYDSTHKLYPAGLRFNDVRKLIGDTSRSMLLSYFTVSVFPYRKTGFHLTYFKKNGTHCQDKMRNVFRNVFCYSTKKNPDIWMDVGSITILA